MFQHGAVFTHLIQYCFKNREVLRFLFRIKMLQQTIHKYNTGYTQVLNALLYDKSISLRAKGLYAYLFSKPDGWEFRISVMQTELQESEAMICNTVKELINAGYIRREQVKENGKFCGVVYEFLPSTEKPSTEKPSTEKPSTENRGTNNTYNKIKLNLSNTDNNIYTRQFAEFWSLYTPVTCDNRTVAKGSKAESEKKFMKILKEGIKYEDIIRGLQSYIEYCRRNNQLTCSVPVFLNQKRWADDYNSATISAKRPDRQRQEPDSILEAYAELIDEC